MPKSTWKQQAELGGVEDALNDGGQYFVDAKWTRDLQTKYQIRDTLNLSIVYLCIEMQNTEYILDKVIDIKIFDANNNDKPLPITKKMDKKVLTTTL